MHVVHLGITNEAWTQSHGGAIIAASVEETYCLIQGNQVRTLTATPG
jgi:hypothetical protein